MSFFKKLFSKPPPPEENIPPEFEQDNPPDWLLDLKGKEGPDGNNFSIRVQLFTAARTGTVEILVLPKNDGEQPQSATTELLRAEIDRLLVVLGFSFPDEIESVAGDAEYGLPIQLSVYRREPMQMRSASCNLADWLDSKKSGPPPIEIGCVLIAARNRALPK